jgi:hypothetical protein
MKIILSPMGKNGLKIRTQNTTSRRYSISNFILVVPPLHKKEWKISIIPIIQIFPSLVFAKKMNGYNRWTDKQTDRQMAAKK